MEGGRMENKNKVLGIIPLINVYGTTKFCSRRCPLLVAAFQSLLASRTSHSSRFSMLQ
jgi:hypothetical protein